MTKRILQLPTPTQRLVAFNLGKRNVSILVSIAIAVPVCYLMLYSSDTIRIYGYAVTMKAPLLVVSETAALESSGDSTPPSSIAHGAPPSATTQCSYLQRQRDELYPSLRDAQECPEGRFVTVAKTSQLGNLICQYLSLYTLSCVDTTVRPAWIQERMARVLSLYFDGLSLPTVPTGCIGRSNLTKINYFKYSSSSRGPAHGAVELTDSSCEQHLFSRFRPDVLKQIHWKYEVLQPAHNSLHNLTSAYCSAQTCTYIGVHVRRGDYIKILPRLFNTTVLRPSYFERAFDVCRSRYPRPVFLVVSDDMPWCRQHLQAPDVVFAGHEGSLAPGIDMAVLSLCNHTVMDFGSFGQIGSFMNGGHVIIPSGVYAGRLKTLQERLGAAKVNFTVIPRETS